MEDYLLETVHPSTLYVTHVFDGEEVVRGGEDGQIWVATFASGLQAKRFIESVSGRVYGLPYKPRS